MSFPAKIDGFGVRRSVTTDNAWFVNTENRGKFVRLYASEPIAKGDLVAFDFHGTEPDNGYGNHVRVCDQDDDINSQGIGIATAAISANAAGVIQVQGICTFAKVDESAVTDGHLLGRSPDDGLLDLFDSNAAVAAGGSSLAIAICVKKAADDSAASIVYLLNPANL